MRNVYRAVFTMLILAVLILLTACGPATKTVKLKCCSKM